MVKGWLFVKKKRHYMLYKPKWDLDCSCDKLRDCRKSPKVAILALLHVMKSDTYKHQNHKFRVFRQSLRICAK